MLMSEDQGEARGTMTGCLSSCFKKIGQCGAQRDRGRPQASVCRGESFALPVTIITLILIAMIFAGADASAATSHRAQAQATRPSPNAKAGSPAGNVANGQRIYLSQGCNKCHGGEGQGAAKETAAPGPPIAATSKSLAAFISIARSPLAPMPPFMAKDVSDAELADVYAFLESVPPSQNSASASASATASAPVSSAAGNAQNGQALFTRDGCYECHGRQAEGSSATGPRLGPSPIPLAALIKYVRQPTGQMPPYTSKVVTDAELADIHAFLQSLPAPPQPDSIPLLKQ
jgi:cytochrome c553